MNLDQYNRLASIASIYTVKAEDRGRILALYKELIQNRFLCRKCDSVVLDCLQKLKDLYSSTPPPNPDEQ